MRHSPNAPDENLSRSRPLSLPRPVAHPLPLALPRLLSLPRLFAQPRPLAESRPKGAVFRPTNIILVPAVIFSMLAASADAQTNAIKIVVQEGQGAINNIQQHRAKEPVVQVQHEDNEPAVGASVSFQLPDSGPGGSFNDNAKILTVQTDDKGQAVAHGLKPNDIAGRFQIRVTASYHGQTASAVVAQINAEPAAAKKGNGKMFLILAIAGGAAAASAAAALGHKGSPSSTGVAVGVTTPPTVLAPGTPSINPPH